MLGETRNCGKEEAWLLKYSILGAVGPAGRSNALWDTLPMLDERLNYGTHSGMAAIFVGAVGQPGRCNAFWETRPKLPEKLNCGMHAGMAAMFVGAMGHAGRSKGLWKRHMVDEL